jgi:hypothetical protein
LPFLMQIRMHHPKQAAILTNAYKITIVIS